MSEGNTAGQKQQDELKVVGLMSKGFGLAPKLVMQDLRLSIEAKAIYNYFASYAGNGDTAFPKVETIIYHLNISESRYYKHFKKLVEAEYISVKQVKVRGKFSHNIYTLNQIIDVTKKISPYPQNEGTVKKPSTQNESTENESPQNESPHFEGSNINNYDINNPNSTRGNINSSKYNQSFYQLYTKNKSLNKTNGVIEGRNEEDLQTYFYNMGIDKLKEDPETIEALKEVIRHMYYSKELKVGKSVVSAGVIKSVISKLNIFHLEYALSNFDEATKTKEIINPLMYMCSTIYNAVINNKFGIQAKVNYDLNNMDVANM